MLVQLCGNFILVCVDSVRLRMILQDIHDLIQCIGCQKVIMIQKSQEFPFRHVKCSVGVLRDPQILFQIAETHSGISGCIICEDALHFFIIRACIGNAELPVGISLFHQTVYHLFQKLCRGLISRNCHTDLGCIGKLMCPLFLQCFLIRYIGVIPWAIGYLFRLEALMKPDPEFLRSVMFQISESFLDRIGRKLL